jgi:disulfide bond formation protein DsbB
MQCDTLVCDSTATTLLGVTVSGMPEWAVIATACLAVLGVIAILATIFR